MKKLFYLISFLFAMALVGCGKEEPENSANGHEYVDLGLPSGTLWATMNVGAKSPESYGGYYAWGETETKSSYFLENYSFYSNGNYSKYNNEDKLENLLPEDDVAMLRTKEKWFIPSNEQINELIGGCDLSWELKNDKYGINK